jgi:preprotein translocase subunit SecG
MFFDNIFGTSDNNNSNNKSSKGDENDNDKYSLKNISLRQGRAFLKDEQKLNRMNTYLAQNTGNSKVVGMNIEGFDNGSQQPQAAAASSSASSAPETVSPAAAAAATQLDKLDDAFDSKMAAYSSALSEFNKELLKNQNYFVVPVKSLTPINSCLNCDASLGGNDCAAMGLSNANGDLRTGFPNSTSPTAQKPQCQVSGVIVPGWFADPNESGSCIARLGQKCCNFSIYNGEPVCRADFGASNYDESEMNSWVAGCITPPSPEEINQKIAFANEYCQGNGIGLNYWSQNANRASQSLVLVTTQEPANDAGVPDNNVRPFAKMNGIPVWMCDLGDPSGINFFSNYEDANTAKNKLVFSPTVKNTLTSAREDMLNAGTALIKAISSQQSTTLADRKAMEQKINAIKTKISKIDSHKQTLDKSVDPNSIYSVIMNTVKPKISNFDSHKPLPASTTTESFMLPSSLQGQEEDTRIQLKSSYSYYTVWFVIAILLIVVMFSNIFMDKKEGGEGEEGGEGGEDSSSVMSSTTLLIGVLMMIVFIYFVVQYILSYFKISRPELPFDSINPLM